MVIHEGYDNIELVNPIVTLGIFDGVHRGHKLLLQKLVEQARALKGESVVITFYPHPRLVLYEKERNLSYLTTIDEKKVLLQNANIDHLIVIDFTKDFSKINACDFVMDVLVKRIKTKYLILGFNHHFGKSGEGDFNTLKECTESLDFTIDQIQGLHTEEGAISSSLIREALLNGRLDEANSLLGYNYSISGRIVEGKKIGRLIGFPTANIKPFDNNKLIPANGVYAVEVLLGGIKYPGMMSIGSNPTVNNDSSIRSIEVNIFEFDKDVYNSNISVNFIKRLRDEIKFENREKLIEQMKLDKRDVLRLMTL